MDTSQLPEVTTTLLDEARAHSAHRAARTLCGGTGHVLRQTAIALLAGSTLSDHENPGEATLQVLVGKEMSCPLSRAIADLLGELRIVQEAPDQPTESGEVSRVGKQ